MTALKKYQRLEATALWRAAPQEQRREVIVSIGDATLVICDLKDQALTHWSLAAVERLNPGERPAIFSPQGDPGETLELALDEAEMIKAIETLRIAVDRARPHPGRLRLASITMSCLAVAALATLWLPGAMIRHAVTVVPDIKRQEIGAALLTRIERVSGPACDLVAARPALARLAARTGAGNLVILPAGLTDSLSLPGGYVLLNRALIEDFEVPDVAAGYTVAERARVGLQDPLEVLLLSSGPLAAFRLITTGSLNPETLDAYAEQMLRQDRPELPDSVLLTAFDRANLSTTPYAFARDVTGETVLGLIEADPMAGRAATPVLPDRDWVQLQNICEG
jgi:hypothetical protein